MTDRAEQEARPLVEALPEEVRATLDALDEHKGVDIVVMDMRAVSGFTDFMVVCTGRSEPHVRALADAVSEKLLGQGIKPSHVEGKSVGHWILLDFLQLVVHVFTPETRSFYQLEKLWRDAPLLEWGVPGSESEGVADVAAAEPAAGTAAESESGSEG
jgi:ribosome-associated protein